MQPETPSERVALVAWYMAFGMALSTKEIAKITGLTGKGAWSLMCRISRVLPVYKDDQDIWRTCEIDSLSNVS